MALSSIDEALRLNRTAVAEYVAVALEIPPWRWTESRRPGKWSPGQITEHVAITYEIARQLVDGTANLPGRKPPVCLRPLIRLLIRATVLRTGKFRKSKTPVAYEPSSRPESQEGLCDRLRRASDAFQQKARNKVNAGINVLQHPYFGRFGVEEFVRLQAHHVRHHRLQLL
jgi:hypothetical protein